MSVFLHHHVFVLGQIILICKLIVFFHCLSSFSHTEIYRSTHVVAFQGLLVILKLSLFTGLKCCFTNIDTLCVYACIKMIIL